MDALGTQDSCVVNGRSFIVPVAVTYRYGQRIQFNRGNDSPHGNLCNLIAGQDTCNPSVYNNICSTPGWAGGCNP